MKKRILTLAFAAVLLLCGCSLIATKDADSNDASSGDATFAPVAMTDSYTFENPAELDFDARYVIYCDENSASVATMKDYGVVSMYSIFYAKADAPVADYEFLICDSAESAKTIADLYASQGMTLTTVEGDENVLYSFSDGDTLEATIITMESYGLVSDSKVSTYAEFMKTTYGGTLLD